MKTSLLACFLIFAIAQCDDPQLEEAVVDLAFVIRAHAQNMRQDYERYDALSKFFADFLDGYLRIEPTWARIAVVKELSNGNFETVCDFKDACSVVILKANLLDDRVDRTSDIRGNAYENLAEEADKQVFVVAKGHRPEAAKLKVLFAIWTKDNDNDRTPAEREAAERFANDFHGMDVRIVAQDFMHGGNKVLFTSTLSKDGTEVSWDEAPKRLLNMLREFWFWCKPKPGTKPSKCFYVMEGKKKQCVYESDYSNVDPVLPGLTCPRGKIKNTCPNAADCKKTCDSTVVWSACDCSSDTRKKIRDPTVNKKLYSFCPPFDAKEEKCSDDELSRCPKKDLKKEFPAWAIVLVAVGASILVIVVVGAAICFVARQSDKTNTGGGRTMMSERRGTSFTQTFRSMFNRRSTRRGPSRNMPPTETRTMTQTMGPSTAYPTRRR